MLSTEVIVAEFKPIVAWLAPLPPRTQSWPTSFTDTFVIKASKFAFSLRKDIVLDVAEKYLVFAPSVKAVKLLPTLTLNWPAPVYATLQVNTYCLPDVIAFCFNSNTGLVVSETNLAPVLKNST